MTKTAPAIFFFSSALFFFLTGAVKRDVFNQKITLINMCVCRQCSLSCGGFLVSPRKLAAPDKPPIRRPGSSTVHRQEASHSEREGRRGRGSEIDIFHYFLPQCCHICTKPWQTECRGKELASVSLGLLVVIREERIRMRRRGREDGKSMRVCCC